MNNSQAPYTNVYERFRCAFSGLQYTPEAKRPKVERDHPEGTETPVGKEPGGSGEAYRGLQVACGTFARGARR